MSIDTCKIWATVPITSKHWVEHEMQDLNAISGEVKHKWVTKGKGKNGETLPRLTYRPESERLFAEVSLPNLTRGENATVLSDDDLLTARGQLIEHIADIVQVQLPPLSEWKVSRLDCCWAWFVDDLMQAYLEVLQQLPVYGYGRKSYEKDDKTIPGFTWLNHRWTVNAYDKGLESGIEWASGLLRLEVQAKKGKACKSIAERTQHEASAEGLICGDVARAVVARWLERIRLPETILTDADIIGRLAKLPPREAAGRYWFLSLFRRHGSGVKKKLSRRTYERQMAYCRKQGLLAASEEHTLDGLKVPSGEEAKKGLGPRVLLGPTTVINDGYYSHNDTPELTPETAPEGVKKHHRRKAPKTAKKATRKPASPLPALAVS